MIKKFAYFKNCVYLCTHKTFAVLLAFFKVSVRCGRPTFLKMFRNISEDVFQKDVESYFRKESSTKKRSKRNLFSNLISISFFSYIISLFYY